VHKGSTQTNKRSKLGFKRKEQMKPKSTLVWRTGLSDVPPDSVRCTRAVRLQTLHLRFSDVALRYNSPDYPVCHRTVRCTSGATLASATIGCNATVHGQFAQKSEQPPEAHRIVHSTCPVQHQTVRCHKKTKLQRSNPNGWVTWLAHRTVSGGAPDCPVRPSTVAAPNS
jgi:hypothetical protein